jgi:hypothetical protein
MLDNDCITVYWAPAPYVTEENSWTQAYPEPVSLLSELNKERNKNNKNKDAKNMFACPSYVDAMKNVFVLKSALDDIIKIPDHLHVLDIPTDRYPLQYESESKLLAVLARETSINNHVNIAYNLGWLMFADEPLEARFTAPYFPAHTPGEGAILAAGQMDIGQWYRDYEIEYHVPQGTDELVIKENQPLAYVQFMTDKKIILKRYNLTPVLRNIASECAESGLRYGRFKTLAQRYAMGKRALLPEQVLNEIKKNLVQ